MKWLKIRSRGLKITTILLLSCFIIQASYTTLSAAYTDQSGYLPGLYDEDDAKDDLRRLSLIAAGALIVGGIIYYIVSYSETEDPEFTETRPSSPDYTMKDGKIKSSTHHCSDSNSAFNKMLYRLYTPDIFTFTYRF